MTKTKQTKYKNTKFMEKIKWLYFDNIFRKSLINMKKELKKYINNP